MNEKIKQIAEVTNCGAFVSDLAPFKKDFEQFAESLIKECMLVITKQVDVKNEEFNRGLVTSIDAIANHFDIK